MTDLAFCDLCLSVREVNRCVEIRRFNESPNLSILEGETRTYVQEK